MHLFLITTSFVTLFLGILLLFSKGKLNVAAPWIINNAFFVYIAIMVPGFAVSLLYLAVGLYVLFHYITHFRLDKLCRFLIGLCVVEVILTNTVDWNTLGIDITNIKTNLVLLLYIPVFFKLPKLLSKLKSLVADTNNPTNFIFHNFIHSLLYTFFFICLFSMSLVIIHLWVEQIPFVFEFVQFNLIASSLYMFYLSYFKYSNQFKACVLRTNISDLSHVEDKTVEEIKRLNEIDDLVNQDKWYLESDISLPSLAERLKIHPKLLSSMINQHYEVSFHEYINKKRIEFAKERLFDPDFANFTIVAIGLESGFSSRSTFYTTFKKFVGCTPTQYKKKVSQNPLMS